MSKTPLEQARQDREMLKWQMKVLTPREEAQPVCAAREAVAARRSWHFAHPEDGELVRVWVSTERMVTIAHEPYLGYAQALCADAIALQTPQGTQARFDTWDRLGDVVLAAMTRYAGLKLEREEVASLTPAQRVSWCLVEVINGLR